MRRGSAIRGLFAAALACVTLTGALGLPTAARSAAAPGADPAAIADSLVAADTALRNTTSSQQVLAQAAHQQQMAYRTLGWHPEWDQVARARIPANLLGVYDRNIDARRQLTALNSGEVKSTLPPWTIIAPAPAEQLLDYYRQAEEATGVGRSYLAAINLVETTFGRIAGASSADARGPMQFLPSTFAQYGAGGDINSPRDAIMAAGRMLAHNGFASNPNGAIYSYNHSDHYVQAVQDYATIMASDPAAFTGYYRWNVFYHTTSGDVMLPVGYSASQRIPVAEYLAAHPQ
ncbi:lytic transglycosylase domain-containing protein [Mycolicibacter acidiphilus]|uniref:lytic transglycosylase domain-containing protein n=1 Tax=Mycolicibacter acidiphilus TaxID=2835306 RepID=UPI003558B0D5